MDSLLLMLPLLVRLFLFHLLMIMMLKIMKLKLKQLVRTQTSENLFQEHLLRLKRKRLRTLGLRKTIIKSLKKRSRISIITVELRDTLVQIAISGQPLQQSNSVLSSGGQDQIPPSLGPLRDLLEALIFLSNLNDFNSFPLPLEQRFNSRK